MGYRPLIYTYMSERNDMEDVNAMAGKTGTVAILCLETKNNLTDTKTDIESINGLIRTQFPGYKLVQGLVINKKDFAQRIEDEIGELLDSSATALNSDPL